MITLERITVENALLFKAVRLRALLDSPTSFSGTYAKESQLSVEDWLERSLRWSSDGSIGLLAFDNGNACGIVAGYVELHDSLQAHVVSMWVDPAYRRLGVGVVLIDALQEWAKARGVLALKLMVTSVNLGAIKFYERIGFCTSGKVAPYPNDPAITEYEMLLPLRT